jgi:hypothetical protein
LQNMVTKSLTPTPLPFRRGVPKDGVAAASVEAGRGKCRSNLHISSRGIRIQAE